MTTDDICRRPLRGKVDFTLMYAVHDDFHRDLQHLTAVEGGQTEAPAVRAGWVTFKNQLHVNHTAEDTSLWRRSRLPGPGGQRRCAGPDARRSHER
jgi:hypothetical protein